MWQNVVEANLLAGTVENPEALNTAYNIAAGRATTLTDLFDLLKSELAKYDPAVAGIRPEFGPERAGDIPHSLADISKAETLLGYRPEFDARTGFALAAEWYFKNAGERVE